MKTVLLLTDFSETANHAASYLSAIAGQLMVERIIIYHAYTNPQPDIIMLTDIIAPMPSGRYALYSDSLNRLNRIKTQLQNKLGTDVTIDVLSDDRQVTKAVEEITCTHQIDLVVLGICGLDAKGINSVGRIPATLMKRHEFPLLIVPSSAVINPVKNMILACELKDIVHRLPDIQLKSIVKSFQATLYVVNIDQGQFSDPAAQVSEQKALYQLLDGIKPEFHSLKNKDIVNGLFDFSIQYHIDLMMVTSKQRSYLETLFHESATRKLALKATKPLLILHKSN